MKVVVLTTFADQRRILDALEALEAGAAGYLLKDAAPDEVTSAVRTVMGRWCYDRSDRHPVIFADGQQRLLASGL